MACTLSRLGAIIKLLDGRRFEIFENDIIYGLEFVDDKSTRIIDEGSVRVIYATTTAHNGYGNNCITEPHMHKYVTPNMILLDSSTANKAVLTFVDIDKIINIKSVKTQKQLEEETMIITGVGNQYRPLSDVINEAEPGSCIKLLGGTYDTPITLNKNITICADGDVIITAPIELKNMSEGDEPLKIKFENLVFSESGFITSAGTSELEMEHCTLGGFNPVEEEQLIHFLSSDPDPILLTMRRCEFLPNNKNCNNLINIYAPLKDGSIISNVVFRKHSCTHNQINLLAVEDDATIYINNNICGYSANMVHIQIPGSPRCTIMLEGNQYFETDNNRKWGGLFFVQPFLDRTVTYENMVIHVNNTANCTDNEQIGYMYIGANDSQLSEDKYPKVFVDGKPYHLNTDRYTYT